MTGSASTASVHLGNFEVEEQWAHGEHTLPRFSAAAAGAVVNRMDEFALQLGGARDHVVLKSAPDPDYLDHLGDLGFDLPQLHVAAEQQPQRTVTEDVLSEPGLLAELSELAADAVFAPHGVSELEEQLADRTGLRLESADAQTCKAVNSKVYSREVADELGLRQPLGWACRTFGGFAEALEQVRRSLDGHRRFVAKEAFGVSGKGIAMLDSPRRADRLHKVLGTKVQRSGSDHLELVLEEWVDKSIELNYQFTVARDGSVRFDFVREQLAANGVHKGHRMPARIDERARGELIEVSSAVGKRLASDGYFGVVGVDAMLDPDGDLYPLVEINARYNMSTYQTRVLERFLGADQVAMARHYPVRLAKPLPFGELREELDGVLVRRPQDPGLLINNFATVNAGLLAADPGTAADGRLYGIVVASTGDQLEDIDTEITARLEPWRGAVS